MYNYRAYVERVIDGDTVCLSVELGFNVTLSETFRLYGINAPEVRGIEKENGLISTSALRDWCEGKEIEIETIKDKKGKYGRYLAILRIDGESLNDRLVSKGYAIKCEY